MNEHGLTDKLRNWFALLESSGLPIRAYKNHGSGFSRDRPDWFLCIVGKFVAIETKNPERPKKPTKKQARELRLIGEAQGTTLVSHDLGEIQRFVANVFADQGWIDNLLEPYR